MTIKLQPIGDRVIIRQVAREEVTKSGIVIPDTVRERPQEGEVLAVGPGSLTMDGKRIEMEVKEGDEVIYAKYAGTEIKVDDEELIVLREGEILARKPRKVKKS